MATQQCFDIKTLKLFLNEQLIDQEENSVLEHIGSCDSCRTKLEELAGDESVWGDIHENLEDMRFDETEAHLHFEPMQDNARDLARVKSLLGPTDDPKMLGRIGHYEVVGIIGRGSAGIVVKALDSRLNRFVAIKILAPVYIENGSARRRFEREGRSIASIRDANVVPVYTVEEYQGLPFIVMQYVPGGSLQQRIDREGPLEPKEAVVVALQIARGLAAAHSRGVVHRDVKPANVLLDTGVERAMVTDFGLARVVDEATMTHSSAISGTPQYMSPEQAQGLSVDQRSDLFSLGSLMYAACTGHAPFRAETVFGVIKRVCDSQPRPIRELNPSIVPWLEALVAKLHSKNREDRFETAEEVAEILSQELAYLQSPTLSPEPKREWLPKRAMVGLGFDRRWLWAGTLVVVLAAVTMGAMSWRGENPSSEVSASASQTAFLKGKYRPFSYGADGDKQSLTQRLEDVVDGIDSDILMRQGNEWLRDEEPGKAINVYRLVLERVPEWPEARYNLACALAQLSEEVPVSEIEETKRFAIVELEKAVEFGFAEIDRLKSDSDLKPIRFESEFQEVLDRAGGRRQANRLAAKAERLFESQKYEEAIASAGEALEFDPSNMVAKYNLALASQFTDDLETAWPIYSELLNSGESLGASAEAICWYNWACIHARRGQSNDAFEKLEKALEVGFDDFNLLKKSDPDLQSLRDDPRFDALLLQHGEDCEEECPDCSTSQACLDLEEESVATKVGPGTADWH
ncbi:MAG: protein kinase [Pirellulaceae bacterium]